MNALFARAAVCILLASSVAVAEPLPLPGKIIDFRSVEGQKLLEQASPGSLAYGRLAAVYETQKTQSYCGVASMVMALNALGAPAPVTPPYAPYAVFTQDNLLDDRSDAIRPRERILMRGMTLDHLGQIASLQPVRVDVRHAGGETVDSFRSAVSKSLGSGDAVVIVNFYRPALDEGGFGHFSPLGAYDAKDDRFLMLDVARYKYPPAWIRTEDLFAAMNTSDPDNDGKSRGWVVISREPASADAAPAAK